ncbi:solute carrier family 2, facilitated glucose transporter member 5-like [Tiliqua scincoides]|uniref:solute carrier family 2, facilitated glucose transporter member 5-like n=1 Tax=Tiliqua scincoides TaxID=71010 RepID=UPI003461CC0C
MEETIEETEPETAEEVRKKGDFTKHLILVTVISSTGFLQYGYNFWVLHFPSVVLMNFYNATDDQRGEGSAHQSILWLLFFLAIALYPLGGLVGSFIFAPLADMCGRQQTLIINNFLSMVCAILMGFSKMVQAYEFSMFSRFLTGVSSGIFSNIVPVYLSEIAPKNRRGAINVVASFFLIFGILIGQVFTAPQLLGNEKGWPILMSFAGFMALFQIVPLFYIPESPRYLLIQKRDEGNARQVLMKLKGQDNVEEEMEDLRLEDHAERTEKNMTIFKLIHFPGLQRRFTIILVLMFAQQFAGYSAMHLIDSVGRRILLLSGFGVCSICCAVLPITIHLQTFHSWMSYINTILIITFLLGHFIGPGSIPHLLVAELFLQSSRSSAFAASGAMFWLWRFIATLTLGAPAKRACLQMQPADQGERNSPAARPTPRLPSPAELADWQAALRAYAFLLYLPVGLATFLFIFKFIPETKKKTFREIRRILATQATKKIVVK